MNPDLTAALCRLDPEAWFPPDRRMLAVAQAAAACLTCPVLDPCRAWTIRNDRANPHEIYGVCGGWTADERRRVARKAVA